MIDSSRMAAVDRNATALGVPAAKLMENAGNALAREVSSLVDPPADIAIVAGRGNNGGDSFVAARHLDEFDVTVSLLGRPGEIRTEISRENWETLQSAEIETEVVRDSTALDLQNPDVIVDAVLGTGVTGAPREPARTAIRSINTADAPVVAVDVPSGMDVDTGEMTDIAVEADKVVTFHDMKPGLANRGNVTVANIGIPDAAERFVGPGDLLALDRPADSHKGDFGRVMVIGGGPYTGAPALAGQAALRTGADLAFLNVPETIASDVQSFSEDLIVEPLAGDRVHREHVQELLDRSKDRDVVVLGPGLGEAAETQEAVATFLERFDGRAVVDADALQIVPDVESDATLVCTPHQAEYADMGGTPAEKWDERADHVTGFASEIGATLLVKGPYDVVSDGETTRVNRTGNAGMTVGGTGDILAGTTGALLARLEPVSAAGVGAYVTGRAGDLVVDAQGSGLLASDLLGTLPRAIWGDR